jgi:hypothetical protein
MITTIVATLTAGTWSYAIDGGSAVAGGSGDLKLPWQYMNDAKQQFRHHSIELEISGLTGSGGTYKPAQTLNSASDAIGGLGTAYSIANTTTDSNKHNFINELCVAAGLTIFKGSMTAVIITIRICIDDIVSK